MDEIDKPFRPKWDFFLVWAVLTIPVFIYRDDLNKGLPWYSVASFVLVVPFFLTFMVYGPVLLWRQTIRSGPAGRFWILPMIIFFAPVIVGCGVLLLMGKYKTAETASSPLLLLGSLLMRLLPLKALRRR